MKKNRKLLGGFVALLHICLIAFPLLVLGYNVAYRTIQSNQSYTQRTLVSEEGNYQLVEYQSNDINYITDMVVGNVYTLYSFYNDSGSTETIQSWYGSLSHYVSFDVVGYYFDLGIYSSVYDEFIGSPSYNSNNYILRFTTFNFVDFYMYLFNDDENYISNFITLNESYDTYINFVCNEELINGLSTLIGYNDDSITYFIKKLDNNNLIPKYDLVDDNLTTTEVTYSFEDNSYLGLRDSLSYFNVMPSDFSLDNFSWSDTFDNSNGFPLLMNVDYLSIFDLGDSYNDSLNSVLAFINFYFNWIINMSIVVFVPEMLIVFIDICRKLIYSFSHKIEGGY